MKTKFTTFLSALTIIASLSLTSIALAQNEETDDSSKKPTPEEIEQMKEKAIEQGTSDPKNTHAFAFELKYQNAIKPQEVWIEGLPGTTHSDTFVAKNKSPLSLDYKFYAVDSSHDTEGRFAYASSSAEKKEVGSWITVTPSDKTLSPQETIQFDFQLKIPEQAELNKTYLGGIMMHREGDKDPNNEALVISTRIGKKVVIKTTNKPFVIPRQSYVYNHSVLAKYSNYYFWGSLGLFILSIIFLGFSSLKNKKKK